MAQAGKAAAVAEITDAFHNSSAAVLTEYRGLTVAQLKQLRRSLGDGANYAVVKNTLTKSRQRGGRRGFRRPAQRPDRDRLHQGRPGRGRQGSA